MTADDRSKLFHDEPSCCVGDCAEDCKGGWFRPETDEDRAEQAAERAALLAGEDDDHCWYCDRVARQDGLCWRHDPEYRYWLVNGPRFGWRWFVWLADELLDRVPRYESRRVYWRGGWGCALRLHRWWGPAAWPLTKDRYRSPGGPQ